MVSLFALALAAALNAQAAPADSNVVLADAERDVSIRYDFTPSAVRFSSRLPAGWSFSVAVDGDQDGRWGDGPDVGRTYSHPTHDFAFGRESGGGFCSQYVLTAAPQNPDRIFASSMCGDFASHGAIENGSADADGRALVTFIIPYQELFGARPEAHLQFCLWDSRRMNCRYGPAAPYILQRPASPG